MKMELSIIFVYMKQTVLHLKVSNSILLVLHLKLKNIMNAIENGIFTESTKSRLDELEKLKKNLTISLQAEQAKHPVLSKEQIIAWFHRLRSFDVKKKEHRERLIDTFINAIFLFDNKLVITFNYQNGSKTILLSDLEKSSCLNEFGRPAFLTKCTKNRAESKDFSSIFVYSANFYLPLPFLEWLGA